MPNIFTELKRLQLIKQINELIVREDDKYEIIENFIFQFCSLINYKIDNNDMHRIEFIDLDNNIMFSIAIHDENSSNGLDLIITTITHYCDAHKMQIDYNLNKGNVVRNKIKSSDNVLIFPLLPTKH